MSELIEAMGAAVPAGRESLDADDISLLRPLTIALLSEMPKAAGEYRRYLAVRDRSLPIAMGAVGHWLSDKTVLVTGGTGCVGSALIGCLLELGARRVVSLSRGVTRDWPRLAGAEYRNADVRDRPVLTAVMADVKPDVVFHLAAQRDPGLAEFAVHHTVTTNVLGTHNVIASAERTGVPQIVFASASQATIPYVRDIHATSRRITEWLAANSAGRGKILCSAARFAPIVDNSVAHRRILEGRGHGFIRVHLPDNAFYVQSAAESAQLLVCAGREPESGTLDVYAIDDLGRPVDLLSLALGALSLSDSEAVIYFTGHDPAYRGRLPIPRQYDPGSARKAAPLAGALEGQGERNAGYGQVSVSTRPPLADAALDGRLRVLEAACAGTRNPDVIRRELDALSRSILEKALSPRAGD